MPDQRLLVRGATGGTGRHVVAQALREGFEVTAFVRDASRLTIESNRLRIQTGDITRDESVLASTMDRQHAVIRVLGVGKSFKSGGIIGRATPRILPSMKAASVRRLVFTSAFRAGESRRDMPPIPRLFMSTLLRDVYRDTEAGENGLRRRPFDSTIVLSSHARRSPGNRADRVGERLALRGFPTIGRADLADFLFRQVGDMK